MSTFEAHPDVPRAPAPWQLTGQGYIVAVRLPEAFHARGSFIPPSLRDRHSLLSYLMFVDYASSDVGPYRELLYIPGSFRFGDARRLSITRIFVSSWASVVNGQENWGIPKDCCDFEVRSGAVDEVKLSLGGKPFAELRFRKNLFPVPFSTALVPAPLRTLAQHARGDEYTYTPQATGHIQPGALLDWRFDAAHFPDLSQGVVMGCVRVADFAMRFPVAAVRKGQGQ
jgi:hypothetical protein